MSIILRSPTSFQIASSPLPKSLCEKEDEARSIKRKIPSIFIREGALILNPVLFSTKNISFLNPSHFKLDGIFQVSSRRMKCLLLRKLREAFSPSPPFKKWTLMDVSADWHISKVVEFLDAVSSFYKNPKLSLSQLRWGIHFPTSDPEPLVSERTIYNYKKYFTEQIHQTLS